MTSILVVCTGNICRSPIAEGLLRDALAARFGAEAPSVSSAGMWGVEGSSATPEAVAAAVESGADIQTHPASIDFLEGIQESGFKIDNPNAVSSCGCGHSFQVEDEGAAEHDPHAAGGGCGSGCAH